SCINVRRYCGTACCYILQKKAKSFTRIWQDVLLVFCWYVLLQELVLYLRFLIDAPPCGRHILPGYITGQHCCFFPLSIDMNKLAQGNDVFRTTKILRDPTDPTPDYVYRLVVIPRAST